MYKYFISSLITLVTIILVMGFVNSGKANAQGPSKVPDACGRADLASKFAVNALFEGERALAQLERTEKLIPEAFNPLTPPHPPPEVTANANIIFALDWLYRVAHSVGCAKINTLHEPIDEPDFFGHTTSTKIENLEEQLRITTALVYDLWKADTEWVRLERQDSYALAVAEEAGGAACAAVNPLCTVAGQRTAAKVARDLALNTAIDSFTLPSTTIHHMIPYSVALQ